MIVSVIQTNLFWEDKLANIKNFEEIIYGISNTNLIVLPEMFTTGFTMNPAPFAETMDGETIEWMKKISSDKDSAICGSLIIKENNNYYNRFVFVKPNGEIQCYDKAHLFCLSKEGDYYTRGNSKIIIEWKGFKILPIICYDLRFPIFARYSSEYDYDILINVANWPKSRSLAWKTLLKARAIENQSFVIGCNRTGVDGNSHEYSGDSCIINPSGETISESDTDIVLTFNLDLSELNKIRNNFPFLKDRDFN